MVSFFTIHGSYCWVGSLIPLSSFHMKLLFTKVLWRHCQVTCSRDCPPEYCGSKFDQMCGISALVFHGTRASNKMASGRLTDQYMGIYLQFDYPDGDCHAGTCHKISNLTNWRNISCAWDPCLHRWVDRTKLRSVQLVHRSVPPSVGISIFNRKSRIRTLGGVSIIWK